uniref:Fibroblast growth factor n=1 Tax=Hucho hucho TaxID=62062 RepID=A0A4W5N3C1_9TELE
MTEGEITLLSLGPTTLDLSKQDCRPLTRLYCMNGGHLQILPDGTVAGGKDENKYDIVKVKAVSAGVVAIKGHEMGRYLAIDKDGNLYGSIKTLKDECYFPEKMEENYYNTNRSQKYQDKDWFLGLQRNGQPKASPRTHIGHKTIYFLPRPVDNTPM